MGRPSGRDLILLRNSYLGVCLMKISSTLLKRYVTASVLVPFVGAPIVAQGALDDVVLLWGSTDHDEEMIGELDSYNVVPLEDVCRTVNDFVYNNLGPVAMSAAMAGIPLPPILPQMDCTDRSFSGEAYYIFTTCSMIMGNGPYWMRWTVPPLAPEASMSYIDPSTNQGYTWLLESVFDAMSERVPMGNLLRFEEPDDMGAVTVMLDVSLDGGEFTSREYTGRTYEFSYEGSISPIGGAQVGALLQLGRVESGGAADIVADAPGADVIGQFYANFTNNVLPHTGANSLFSGMMAQMAGLAELGIPIRVTQSNSGGVGLATMAGSANLGVQSMSESLIERIMILPGQATETCGATVFPEGMEIVDLGEQMAESMAEMNAMLEGMSEEDLAMLQQFGGAGGLGQMLGGAAAAGAGAAGAAGGTAQQMTPEQQAAMAQAAGGLGAMIGGLTGAAAGAGGAEMTAEQQAAMAQVSGMLGGLLGGAAAAGGSPGAAATTGSAAPAAARPSGPSLSSALMTDDLTQSAQNMLEALGYDPGNTDGELSVETTIAISQFQAEQGMEVTGEVTPQLLGILAAQVDAL
jgi:hypothetical protein